MRQTLILRLYVFWKISVAKPRAKRFSYYNLGLEAFVHGFFADFYEVKSSFLLLNEVLFISITLIQFIPYLTLVYRMITLSCNPFCSKLQCIWTQPLDGGHDVWPCPVFEPLWNAGVGEPWQSHLSGSRILT